MTLAGEVARLTEAAAESRRAAIEATLVLRLSCTHSNTVWCDSSSSALGSLFLPRTLCLDCGVEEECWSGGKLPRSGQSIPRDGRGGLYSMRSIAHFDLTLDRYVQQRAEEVGTTPEWLREYITSQYSDE